jgi:hypothetical protein
MRTVLFMLGAKDPEMDRIEQLLTERGESFVHAFKDGRRVNPGNAYDADLFLQEVMYNDDIVFVECAVPKTRREYVIDHHRPGDPGYDKGASEYWAASSIGQLYTMLGITEIPQTDRVLAATDHCFAAAIQGLCPGVSVEEVRALKEDNIARTLKISVDDVRAEVQRHFDNLGFTYDVIVIGQSLVAKIPYTGIGYTLSYLSAQFAAVLAGVAVLITLRTEFEDEPLRYHLCGNASVETVEAFMNTWAPDNGLERIYGVPERGYAGGYVKQ